MGKVERIFTTQNENCVYGYLAACTQPRWPNYFGSLEFWCSVYNSSTSFSLDTIYGLIHSKMSEQFKKKNIFDMDMQ